MRTYIDFMIDEANEAHNVDLRNLPATAPLFAYLHAASLGAVECKYKHVALELAKLAAADNYRDRFTKFIAYWRDVGCPVPDEQIEILETKYGDTIINTRSYGTRGAKDKYLVKFREPLDELPELEGKDDFCTWRRMAMCIIKNDFVCKGLSFSITKEMKARRDAVLAKFRSL